MNKVEAWDFEDGIIVWGTHDIDEAEVALISLGKEQGIPVVFYEAGADYDGSVDLHDAHYNLYDLQRAQLLWGHKVLVERSLEVWPVELHSDEPFEDAVPFMVAHF